MSLLACCLVADASLACRRAVFLVVSAASFEEYGHVVFHVHARFFTKAGQDSEGCKILM